MELCTVCGVVQPVTVQQLEDIFNQHSLLVTIITNKVRVLGIRAQTLLSRSFGFGLGPS